MSKFGASGYYKAVMIASGGLSGGLNSCIAGGIPIAIGRKGVQQGLLTSGLNHAAGHMVNNQAKHKFQKEIDKAYGSKADEPVYDMSQADVDDAIQKLPTLQKIYSKLLLKFKNLRVNYIDKFFKKDGITNFDTDNNTVSSISIFRSAGSSYRYMSETILHEFGHAMSGYHGFFFQNFKKYGRYSDVPVAIDEIYAHKFAFYHGGVSYNTAYYNSFVNFLSRTSYKINANNIVLPNF